MGIIAHTGWQIVQLAEQFNFQCSNIFLSIGSLALQSTESFACYLSQLEEIQYTTHAVNLLFDTRPGRQSPSNNFIRACYEEKKNVLRYLGIGHYRDWMERIFGEWPMIQWFAMNKAVQ